MTVSNRSDLADSTPGLADFWSPARHLLSESELVLQQRPLHCHLVSSRPPPLVLFDLCRVIAHAERLSTRLNPAVFSTGMLLCKLFVVVLDVSPTSQTSSVV